MQKKLIRFDWATKKLLQNKANYVVLEGFLSELLKVLDVDMLPEDERKGYRRFMENKMMELGVVETAVNKALQDNALKTAKNLKSKGYAIEEIIEIKQLSKEDIDKL